VREKEDSVGVSSVGGCPVSRDGNGVTAGGRSIGQEGASDKFGWGGKGIKEREKMDVDEVGDKSGSKIERAAA
jgi:hypothetical protein